MSVHSELSAMLLEARQNLDFLGTLQRLTPTGNDERKLFFESLSAIHNLGEIDLVHEFAELRNEQGGHDFFLTRHIFENTLPDLTAKPVDVARTVAHLVRQAAQDLAAETPLSAFGSFLNGSPERPAEVLTAIEEDPDHLAILLPATAAAGFIVNREFFIDQLTRLVGSPIDELARAAVFSLGNAAIGPEVEIPPQVIQALEAVVQKASQDGTLAATLSAAVSLVSGRHSVCARLEEVIRETLEKGGEWTLHAAARAFAFQTEKLGQPLVELLSKHLKMMPTANHGILQFIDFGVSSLMKSTNQDLGLGVLETILRRFPDKVELKTFSCTQTSIESSPELLSKVVTRWLASGEVPLCKAARDAVQHARRDDVTLDVDITQLDSADSETLVFVARKAVGYLFVWPIAASSFIVSMMRVGAIDTIKQLLLDPLLLNYTGSVREFLQIRIESEPEAVASAIRECIEQIDAYLAEIRTALEVRELRASDEQRATFQKLLSQKVSVSFEAAQKEMPLLSLVKRSIVLHGRGSVQHVAHQNGSSHRADMMFKTYGTDMLLPRMMHIDEFGLNLELRIFRAEKRAE